ncbi:MAG: C40 family peptidase, partial [Myxococcales bacterium]|nr:C40 family peptidase [Myxococcales bacterium]
MRARRPKPNGTGLLAALLVLVTACGASDDSGKGGPSANTSTAECPAKGPAPNPLPHVGTEQRTLAYWISRTAHLDDVVLDGAAIARHNRALLTMVDGEPLGQMDLHARPTPEWLAGQLATRNGYMRERIENGTYLDSDGHRVGAEAFGVDRSDSSRGFAATTTQELRVALELVPMRCAPKNAGLYTKGIDLNFDRNLCSTARPMDLIEVLGSTGDLWLVRTKYALGWVSKTAKLSPPLDGAARAAWLDGSRIVLRSAWKARGPAGEVELAPQTLLPTDDGGATAWVADARGAANVPFTGERITSNRSLTRRAVLAEAFSLIDTPYGWGGREGGRDCSQFLLDVFDRFGLHIPRHSARQAIGGSYSMDVTGTPDADKTAIVDAAAERGIVLLHFPGHIMLYLGRDASGTPMAIHAFAEYLEPCKGGGETLRTVDRVTVSDLTLGKGTSRTSFLERITRVTVLGSDAGETLEGIAQYRPPAAFDAPADGAACADTDEAALFRSPARPHAGAPMRVIATLSGAPGAARLALFGPGGARVDAEAHRLPGPPFVEWNEVAAPAAGAWVAVVADGDRVLACERFRVSASQPAQWTPTEPDAPAWTARLKWERDTENLYAAFVAQLFNFPPDEDRTWTNLQALLQDPKQNLLLNHLSEGEDAALELEPDCADLPYFLRTYFAWKLGLPLAFRRCSRGREGVPPSCGDMNTNLTPVAGETSAERFASFVRMVASGVHSATARTAPADDATDVYPVDLTREALLPGTVFADPYGHLLVIASWVPQPAGGYGMLIGAEAQPDGTIGRRRFWEGTFLFTPETKDVGAGFKAWRPLVYDAKEKVITALTNDELKKSREHTRWSNAQYGGTKADFYARVDALANPRPLDPERAQLALVDALEEAVKRRVLSVQNGVDYMNGVG